jgi:tripartite-type tricarboxylate transporter receptor subunit TctC
MLEHLAGIKMLAVPYKTQAQAAAALAGGEVDFLVTDVPTALPFYSSGRLRPLATTGRTRLTALPKVPTVREQGVNEYEFAAWHAVFVPKRTPTEVVNKLRALLQDAAKSKYVADVLASKGSESMNLDTPPLTALIRKDIEGWGKLLRDMKKSAR